MKPTETDAAAKRKYVVLNLLVAALSLTYASVVAWAALNAPLAEPVFVGVYLIIVLSSALATNRGAAVVQTLSPPSTLLRRAVSVLKWPATLLLPFILASSVYDAVVSHGVETVKTDLAGVIEYLDEELETRGAYPKKLSLSPMAMSATKSFTYFTGPDNYVLSTGGVSIDMDGSTIFYSSTDGSWRRFHNDDADSDAGRLFKDLTDDTAAIRYRLRDGAWEATQR